MKVPVTTEFGDAGSHLLDATGRFDSRQHIPYRWYQPSYLHSYHKHVLRLSISVDSLGLNLLSSGVSIQERCQSGTGCHRSWTCAPSA